MITHHTQLLNALIDKYKLTSFLEIGIFNADHNFNKIKCERKYGIDPDVKGDGIYTMTSDEYFNKVQSPYFKFDIIFIDGLHHADQVKRDFENSLRCLSDNGFIVIHDVLPENEEGTIVPRQTKIWWGSVYQFAMRISMYTGVHYKTYNIDNGCMVIWKDPSNSKHWPFIKDTDYSDWDWFKIHGRTLMNVQDEVKI